MGEQDTDVKLESASSVDSSATTGKGSQDAQTTATSSEQGEQTVGDVVAKAMAPYKAETAAAEESGLQSKPDDKKAEVNEEHPGDEDKPKGPIPYDRFAEVYKKAKTFEEQVKAEEPLVNMAKEVNETLTRYGISQEDFRAGLDVMALLRHDPLKARERLMPIMQQLNSLVGETLAPDLQKRVDDGVIPIEVAKEIAALRAKTALTEHSGRVSQEQQQRAFQQEVATSLNSWDASKRQADLAFKPKEKADAPDGKYEVFTAQFLSAMQMTPPRSINEAVTLAERAYERVNTMFKSFTPAPKQRKVLTSSSSSQTATVEVDTTKPGWAKKIAREVVSQYAK